MNKFKLNRIDDSYASYQSLINLYESYKEDLFSDIHLELRGFFSANLSSVLGAILDNFKENINDIHFDYITPQVEQILLKNEFLSYYGKTKINDLYNTTIKFQKLKPSDGKFFKNYVITELIDAYDSNLPKMSKGVKDKIVESIYEIFINAQMHSNTNFIYTCGQFFPNQNKIEFCIVDTGVGFKKKVNQRFQVNLNSLQAIRWAVQDKKTTKIEISGGIGLALLKEFVKKNKGKMQIISNDGFYEFDGNTENARLFNGEFPGTIVNLQFNTNDNINYLLKSEIDNDEIF